MNTGWIPFPRVLVQCKRSNHHHHHHLVVPLARISLTLSRHFSLSFITSGRSSGLHPVSSDSCCMYILAGRPAFARPYVGVHRSTSLMSSILLLQQCPACLVRLTWIVFVMGGRWPYSWCFVRLNDLIRDLNFGPHFLRRLGVTTSVLHQKRNYFDEKCLGRNFKGILFSGVYLLS